MAKDNDIGGRLKAVVSERHKAEAEYEKRQEKLRKLERGTAEYDSQLAKVNESRDEIGRIGDEHAELARAYSLAQGGTNHAPPRTP